MILDFFPQTFPFRMPKKYSDEELTKAVVSVHFSLFTTFFFEHLFNLYYNTADK